jgi:8-oxo-dGTP pyrophosphatase MutT (NUDIX family)
MRQSEGSLAYIERRRGDRVEILTQWNEGWRAYNLVGGHKRAAESFRLCVAREVTEELGLAEGEQFSAGGSPLARLEYVDWSEKAGVETAYILEVYRVDLAGPAIEHLVSANPANRWVVADEIRAGVATGGGRISPTVARVLDHLADRVFPAPSPPGHWSPRSIVDGSNQ